MQLFSIIVFGCISSQGWRIDADSKQEYCLYNNNPNACNYGIWVGVIGFLASMGFIAGEYFFEQMSSVKTRKHYVLGDLAFSGKICTQFLYVLQYCIILVQYSNNIIKCRMYYRHLGIDELKWLSLFMERMVQLTINSIGLWRRKCKRYINSIYSFDFIIK